MDLFEFMFDFPLQHAVGSQISHLHSAAAVRSFCRCIMLAVNDLAEIVSLHTAAGRCDSLLYDAVGSRILLLQNAAGRQIFPLHHAAGSQILPPHDAAGSHFGSRESSPKTLEDSLGL